MDQRRGLTSSFFVKGINKMKDDNGPLILLFGSIVICIAILISALK